MTNKLYAWDEIDDEIRARDPEDMFRCNAEGGWVSEGWLEGDVTYGKPVVEIRTNGRHYALETWAKSRFWAHHRFLKFSRYREMAESEEKAIRQEESNATD